MGESAITRTVQQSLLPPNLVQQEASDFFSEYTFQRVPIDAEKELLAIESE